MTALPDLIAAAALENAPGIRHGFFTRRGGVSGGLYDSLNCGFSTGDDRDKVQTNRDLAMARLGLTPDRLAAVQQVHGDRVIVIDDDWTPGSLQQADGLVTKRRGVALGVLGADCAPILLADPDAGVVGAAHAGWRGALSGVLDNAVMAMIGLGARPARMIAAIGPAIARGSYEVGVEFPAPFLAQDPANATFFDPGRGGKLHFDLPGYIAARLTRCGVGEILPPLGDTVSQPDLFFSHRRAQLDGEPASGRHLSAIAIED